jgi:hypothetical protein
VVDFSYVSVLVLLGMNLVVGFHRRKSLGCLVIVSLVFLLSAFLMTGEPR